VEAVMTNRNALSLARKLGRAGRSAVFAAALALCISTDYRPAWAQAKATPSVQAVVDDLVTANRILFHQGVLDGFGHVSVRHPGDKNRFLMAWALAAGLVAAEDIMEFDLDAKAIEPRAGRRLYSERFIHSEIYKARPDVNAIVHSHSPSVIPFSVTQVPLRPVMTTAAFLYKGAPVFEIRKYSGKVDLLVTNGALGKGLADTLGGANVALMRGHGDVVVAPNLRSVVSRAIRTEINARLQMQALALGGPITYVSQEEGERHDGPDAQEREPLNRAWDMWKREALGK
jgi:HCOMODA/2-hydroxy-3-carboxy-muconic semialdehyde decarboxylase